MPRFEWSTDPSRATLPKKSVLAPLCLTHKTSAFFSASFVAKFQAGQGPAARTNKLGRIFGWQVPEAFGCADSKEGVDSAFFVPNSCKRTSDAKKFHNKKKEKRDKNSLSFHRNVCQNKGFQKSECTETQEKMSKSRNVLASDRNCLVLQEEKAQTDRMMPSDDVAKLAAKHAHAWFLLESRLAINSFLRIFFPIVCTGARKEKSRLFLRKRKNNIFVLCCNTTAATTYTFAVLAEEALWLDQFTFGVSQVESVGTLCSL